jgi:hypothetical protein
MSPQSPPTVTVHANPTRGGLALLGLLATAGLMFWLSTSALVAFRTEPSAWAHLGQNIEIAICWATPLLGAGWALMIITLAIRGTPMFVMSDQTIEAWDDLGRHWRLEKPDVQRAVFYEMRGRDFVAIVGTWTQQHNTRKRTAPSITRPLAALDMTAAELARLLESQSIQIARH